MKTEEEKQRGEKEMMKLKKKKCVKTESRKEAQNDRI